MNSKFTKLGNRTYCLESKTTKRSILGTVLGDDQILYIDAGTSPAHMNEMLNYTRSLHYNEAIRSIGVFTDAGLKHVLGMKAVGKTPFISHALTKSKMDEMLTWKYDDASLEKRVQKNEILLSDFKALKKDWEEPRNVELVVPCIIYRHKLELDLGKVSVLLEHIESDHRKDSTIVYVKEDNILFIGDVLEPGYNGHSSFYTKQLLEVIDSLMKYQAKYYITSKAGKIYTKNDFFEYCEYLRIVGATVSEYFNDISMIEETLGGNLDKNAQVLVSAFMNGLKVDPKI